MMCEFTEEEGMVITLGCVAFDKVKAKLTGRKGYQFEMTDTEIKLRGSVIRSNLFKRRLT